MKVFNSVQRGRMTGKQCIQVQELESAVQGFRRACSIFPSRGTALHAGRSRVQFRTTEMKTIRATNRKTYRDKIHSDHLRHLSGIQDVVKWIEDRRREWDVHVGRMEDNRLAKIARDSRPQGVRSRGRPKKRWKECLIKAPSP